MRRLFLILLVVPLLAWAGIPALAAELVCGEVVDRVTGRRGGDQRLFPDPDRG